MNSLIDQLTTLVTLSKQNFYFTCILIGILWVIQIINWLLGNRLNYLGIYPRHLLGLPGIICSPFLHGNFEHLFLNTIPLLILIDLVLMAGQTTFFLITFSIILQSGFAVWLFARRAIHVGASSLILGYWGYLLMNSYHAPSAMTVILAILCIYYLGSLALSLLPLDAKASWEGHVFGFLAGISTAYLIPWVNVY